MTTRPPNPLTPTRRHTTAAALRALADELELDRTDHALRTLHTLADPTWPTTTTGTNTPTGTSSRTETTALRPDPSAARATRTLHNLARLERLADTIRIELLDCRPDRPVAIYPACGHPVDRRYQRCQHTYPDGTICGTHTTTDTLHTCHDCRGEFTTAQTRPYTIPGTDHRIRLCIADYWARARTGRPRVSIARLARDAADLIAPDGTYTTPDTEAG